ncbi:hypothetical protein HDU87_006682 [Geranomyces variabilis]|uniref:Uncharacterized protein n=1 Tax=Geranomyces variabilis TaxID=109894 RepID=A0AAD5TRT5_9FUNG|nr:hypothetical protein HDU87_006682 [Geranomyces variabilis]
MQEGKKEPLADQISYSKHYDPAVSSSQPPAYPQTSPPPPPSKMGLAARFSALSWSQLAVGLSVLTAVIVIPLEVVVISQVHAFLNDAFEIRGSLIFVMVYFALFILALVFQAVLTAEAYVHKNTMQTLAVAIFNVACFGYSIVQVQQFRKLITCNEAWMEAISEGYPQNNLRSAWDDAKTNNQECMGTTPRGFAEAQKNKMTMEELQRMASISDDPVTVARIVSYAIIGVLFVTSWLSCYLAYKVYREYGWHIFQSQGASLVKKRLLRHVHLFILLLKVNLYFSVGIFVQVLVAMILAAITNTDTVSTQSPNVSDPTPSWGSQKSYWIPPLVLMGLFATSYYACGWYAIQYAHRPSMYAFFALLGGNIAAVIFVLVASHTQPLRNELKITDIWLTSFAAVQLLLNIMTIANAVMCLRGFDTGLREMVDTRRQKKDVEMTPSVPRPRIEID